MRDAARSLSIFLAKSFSMAAFHGSRQLVREYDTLADLEEGARLGCAFCKLLYACHCRSAGSKPAADLYRIDSLSRHSWALVGAKLPQTRVQPRLWLAF